MSIPGAYVDFISDMYDSVHISNKVRVQIVYFGHGTVIYPQYFIEVFTQITRLPQLKSLNHIIFPFQIFFTDFDDMEVSQIVYMGFCDKTETVR